MVARSITLVVAVAAIAWFALGVRQAHDVNAASSILGAGASLTAAQAAHVQSLLHDAGQLNPDLGVTLLRSQLALRRGDPAGARAIALGVTRAEPDDLQAWVAYGRASANDPAAFALALRRLNQLAPLVGSRH